MTEARLYTVRPFSKPARTDFKDVFRISVSPSILLLYRLRPGDACHLRTQGSRLLPAIAWAATEKIQDSIVQTSKTFQDLHGLKLGDKVFIEPEDGSPAEAASVLISEILSTDPGSDVVENIEDERKHWSWFLEYPFGKAEILSTGMVFEGIELRGHRKAFRIEQINSSTSPDALYRFVSASTIKIVEASYVSSIAQEGLHRTLKITRDGIGGLNDQLHQLNARLAAYNSNVQRLKLPPYYRPHRGGVLLYGQSGTGKSLILQKLAEADWQKVFHINTSTFDSRTGTFDAAIAKIFQEARCHQPSVILIDRLDTIAGKPGEVPSRGTNVASSLCDGFAQLKDTRVLVVAASTDLSKLDESLRRPGCFEFQIEVPIPDSKARTEILKILSNHPRDEGNKVLENIGERTHGFVGADLDKVVQLAVEQAKSRVLQDTHSFKSLLEGSSNHVTPRFKDEESLVEIVVEVTEADLNNTLLEVRPTAMQEVFLETPKVRWTDIGGLHGIKKTLKQAVEWPFKYPTHMARLGIDPKKGLLLYGPPGCSKTLIAKAVATEAGLNFLAVKGAELLSMYVGESERAVREVFRKARAARPSIIFFDEIDAIGAARDGGGQHAGLNVLTTLLNELDGIEALNGVFILGATNKPEVLDPALMRPGRLDTSLYVGPPDLAARLEILAIRISKMDVEAEVDLVRLAERTEHYSGAELVSICQKAGYAALEEQENSGEEKRVGMRHFVIGLGEVQRQITKEMRERYETWGARARM